MNELKPNKNELKPNKDDWYKLYFFPALFIGSAGYIIFTIKFPRALFGAIPLTLIALGYHFIHKNDLKVVALNKPGTKANFQACLKEIRKQGWEVLECDEDSKIFAKTQYTWFSWGWGERVTLFFEENNIYINSRPSSEGSSIFTWGKNKKNISKIRSALEYS